MAAAIALGLAGQPVASFAATADSTTYYTTRLVELYGSPGPYTGTLTLRISRDNIVNGYYRPEGGVGSFIPITGGRNGKDIWFDIGSRDYVHVTATLEGSTIVGTAIDAGNIEYTFTAAQTANQTA